MKAQKDQIGHTAHFGGALGGILITIIFVPEVVQSAQLMLGILSITTLIAGILIYRRQ
jgi:membrane associated rhomboid family serine protease